jgi:hypothetical protein
MEDVSRLQASIDAADELARTEASYAAAAVAYRSALALAFRATPRGSKEAQHCLLRMARLLRLLGRLEEAAKAFSLHWTMTECPFIYYERMACVLQLRQPTLYADLVRVYNKVVGVTLAPLDGADAFLVGFPWKVYEEGRSLCAEHGLLPAMRQAWSVYKGDYETAAIAATEPEKRRRLRDTAALRRAADAAVFEGHWERASEVLHELIASATSPAHVLLAMADVAHVRYQQGRFEDAESAAHAAGVQLDEFAPQPEQAAATRAAKAMCAEIVAASHMRSWRAGAVPEWWAWWAQRASARMQLAVYFWAPKGQDEEDMVPGTEYVLLPMDCGWLQAVNTSYMLNIHHKVGKTLNLACSAKATSDTTHALQLCNNARIAEAKGEWSAAAELWEAALAKMCTPAVLRGVKCVDVSSMLCAHLMACPALSPAEQAAICDAWLLGYDRSEPLSLEALVAGRATFGEAVGSDADILQAVLDRRDACARGRHP